MNTRDEFRNVSVTEANALSAAGWALSGRGRHTLRCQPACCQPQAQYRLA